MVAYVLRVANVTDPILSGDSKRRLLDLLT